MAKAGKKASNKKTKKKLSADKYNATLFSPYDSGISLYHYSKCRLLTTISLFNLDDNDAAEEYSKKRKKRRNIVFKRSYLYIVLFVHTMHVM